VKPTIINLTAEHAEAAARLVAARLAFLERDVPELGTRCGSPETLASRIARLAGRGPGVAAVTDGRLVGFIGALPIRYGGRSSMLSPEWGNGTAPEIGSEAARRVLEALYTRAAEEWTAGAVETHLLCLLADDAAAFETVSWLGFGRVVCDAVRPIASVAPKQGTCTVRRATPADAETVAELDRRLHAHTRASPVFLVPGQAEDIAWWEERLRVAATAVWIAETSANTVGYLIQGPATDDACDLIVDLGTSSITGAYVLPEARGAGVAASLLARAVDWAREQGYVRLAVDFETANIEGSRFWLRHFRPVVVSFSRTVSAYRDSL